VNARFERRSDSQGEISGWQIAIALAEAATAAMRECGLRRFWTVYRQTGTFEVWNGLDLANRSNVRIADYSSTWNCR
jgi:hypothetical protein